MIIDSIENAGKYFDIHPLFSEAFDYIRSTDMMATEPGKFTIADGLIALYNDAPGKSKEDSLAKFECHNKNIDIQYCIRGQETLGWKPRQQCVDPKGDYNEEKDVLFYNDIPDMFFGLKENQFAIFFPEDVHAPMIGEGNIKKLVMKVRCE